MARHTAGDAQIQDSRQSPEKTWAQACSLLEFKFYSQISHNRQQILQERELGEILSLARRNEC